jgi:hypothetical protein
MEQHNNTNYGLDSNPFLAVLTSVDGVDLITDSDNGFLVDVTSFSNVDYDMSLESTEYSKESYVNYYNSVIGRGISPVNEKLMGKNLAMHMLPLDDYWIKLSDQVNEFITNTYDGKIKNYPLDWEMLP